MKHHLKKELRNAALRLIADYSRQEYYSHGQVLAAANKLQINEEHRLYVCALFLDRAEFYSLFTEEVDYTSVRNYLITDVLDQPPDQRMNDYGTWLYLDEKSFDNDQNGIDWTMIG